MDGRTDGQTDKQADKQTDIQADRQTDRQRVRQTDQRLGDATRADSEPEQDAVGVGGQAEQLGEEGECHPRRGPVDGLDVGGGEKRDELGAVRNMRQLRTARISYINKQFIERIN